MKTIGSTFLAILNHYHFMIKKLMRPFSTPSTYLQQFSLRLSKYLPGHHFFTTKNTRTYRLKDKTCVELGLIGPQDRERYLQGFSRISSKTNINRFHTFKNHFTDKELDYLLNIDNIHHLAVGAVECGKNDIGIGIARYISQTETPQCAEAALVVIDEYQGRGLGKLLYQTLINKAIENGITSLHNAVIKDNRAMLHILQQLGAKQISENEHIYELELKLPVSAASGLNTLNMAI